MPKLCYDPCDAIKMREMRGEMEKKTPKKLINIYVINKEKKAFNFVDKVTQCVMSEPLQNFTIYTWDHAFNNIPRKGK